MEKNGDKKVPDQLSKGGQTPQFTPSMPMATGSVLYQALSQFQSISMQKEPDPAVVKEIGSVVKQLSSDALEDSLSITARGSKSDDDLYKMVSASASRDFIITTILIVIMFLMLAFGSILVIYDKTEIGIPIITAAAGAIFGFWAGSGYASKKPNV
ncbi:MAG: hypothetical protein ABIE07_13750 [Candidatus Zixiibacteriota bacterium]